MSINKRIKFEFNLLLRFIYKESRLLTTLLALFFKIANFPAIISDMRFPQTFESQDLLYRISWCMCFQIALKASKLPSMLITTTGQFTSF